MVGSGGLETSGAPQVGAYLAGLPASVADAVDAAFTEHGRDVVTAAQRLAPQLTGGLRAAITATTTPGALTVDAGTATKPHAYTMHAQALGTSNGYMVFRVGQHSRTGTRGVSAYKARRAIPNRQYLFLAWQQRLSSLHDRVTTAVADKVRG